MTVRAPDSDALRYATYWELVLAPAARRMLARIDVAPGVYLDVGAGTGGLALMAAQRWPDARIVALDASAGMLSVGRARVAEERSPSDAGRFEWLAADAGDIPLEDASVDVATTSFMLQLVDDRAAVLAEVGRVLRPGGMLGLVTWLADDLVLPADDAFEAVVAHFGLDEESGGFRPGRTTDYESVEEARDELEAAGFCDIDAREDELRYAWTREEYLVFKEQYDDREVFEALDETSRERFRGMVQDAWAELPESGFEVRGGLVTATARVPGRQIASGSPGADR